MYDWDVFIRLIPLPYTVEGVTVPNPDGTFSVYINSNLCSAKQQAAADHELHHIKKNHFYDCHPVVFNELSADSAV